MGRAAVGVVDAVVHLAQVGRPVAAQSTARAVAPLDVFSDELRGNIAIRGFRFCRQVTSAGRRHLLRRPAIALHECRCVLNIGGLIRVQDDRRRWCDAAGDELL